MGQIIRMIKPKRRRKPRGIFIDKRSIGTVYIANKAYTYNADKVLTNQIDYDDAVDHVDRKRAKRRIYIRRR